jgi:hypothetical protein
MYLGVIDLMEGHLAGAKRSLESTLAQARRMGRYNLEVRSRLYLARLALAQHRPDDALDLLKPVPQDGQRVVVLLSKWRSLRSARPPSKAKGGFFPSDPDPRRGNWNGLYGRLGAIVGTRGS